MPNIKHSERFGGSSNIGGSPGGENIRTALNSDTTFTVRTDGSGDYTNIFIALADLSDNYEINNIVTLDLDPNGDAIITAEMPMFLGKGRIVLDGNGASLQFFEAPGLSEVTVNNYTSVTLEFKDIILANGSATTAKMHIAGQHIFFNNVDFGDYLVDVDGGADIQFTNCQCNRHGSVKVYRSTVSVTNCAPLTFEGFYSTLTCQGNTFRGVMIIDSCNVVYDNNRLDHNWFLTTTEFSNSTVRFAGWFTAQNLGGNPTTKNLIRLQACSIKSLPLNIDIQGGGRTFDNCSILKLVNCTTPEDMPNVSYDFSAHTFQNGAVAIELINTSLINGVDLTGGTVSQDSYSIYDGKDFDPTGTSLTSTNKSDAIIELYNIIQAL